MNFRKNKFFTEPACVLCSASFCFKDPTNPYGARCPLLLHCGHSACEGCLKSVSRGNNTITCSVCTSMSETTKFRSPQELREEFPLNVYAVGQVSLKRNSKSRTGEALIGFYSKNNNMNSSAVICGECEVAAADCSCRQCSVQFCDACFNKVHSGSVTLRKHEKISLGEAEKNIIFDEAMCKDHQGMVCKLYCKDCEMYGCKQCIFDKHLEHQCVDVYQKNEEKLSEFSELYDEANAVLKQLYATRKKLQHSSGQFQDEEVQKVEKDIAIHYNHLHGMLQRQEEELMKKIRSVSEGTHESLENVAQELDKNIKEVEAILNLSKNAADPTSLKDFPLTILLDKLRNITATPCHLMLSGDNDKAKFELYIDKNVYAAFKSHCVINVPTKRVYDLRSKFDLPEGYEVENLQNIPDPFTKPDLKLIKSEKDMSNPFLSAIASPSAQLPQTEVKTKPTLFKDVLRRNRILLQQNKPSDTHSNSSQESAVENMCNVQALQEGTNEIVRMCHLSSPNSFYVQRKVNFSQIDKLRQLFSRQANIKRNHPGFIKCGQMYLVNFSGDEQWYRARVTKFHGNTCDVFYIDYGNTETVNKNKLRDIPEKYMAIPDQAIHCGLYNCVPVGNAWSTDALRLFTSMSHNNELNMYVERINKDTGFHEVHLRSLDDKHGSFTDALLYSGFATRTESTSQEGGLFKQPTPSVKKNAFKNTVIKEGEIFDGQVTHINSPSHFYVQKLVDGGELLLNLMKELSNVYKQLRHNELVIYTPIVGMPVAARFLKDNRWYRGVILGIPEPRMVQVKYVDFGNVETTSCDNIRALQNKFLRMGAQGLKCSLSDVAPKHPKGWPASAKVAFEKTVMNKGLLRVYVEKLKEDNSLNIVLYETTPTKYININGLMVKKGHALSTGLGSARSEFPFSAEPNLKIYHVDQKTSDSDSLSVYSDLSELSLGSQPDKKGFFPNTKQEVPDQPAKPAQMAKNTFISVPKTEETAQPEADEVGRVKILIKKLISPSEIYVSFSQRHKRILKLITEMTAYYESSLEENREWVVGDLCAVFKKTDKKWYRGIISEVSYSNYKVFIKDIVEVVEVDMSELRTLEPLFTEVADGSVKIHLGGIRIPAGLKTWPSSTTDYLKKQVEGTDSLYMSKMGEVVNDSLPVCLWKKRIRQGGALDALKEEWEDINKILIDFGFVLIDHSSLAGGDNRSLYSSSDEVSIADQNVPVNSNFVMEWLDQSFKVAAESPYVSDFEKTNKDVKPKPIRGRFTSNRPRAYIPTPIGLEGPEMVVEWKPALPFKKLNFTAIPTYVDHDCAVYIQDEENSSATLELLEKALLNLFEDSTSKPHDRDWSEGQICVAYYEQYGKWYRGKVMKVKPEYLEVLFVDYGNVEHLQADQLRKQVTMGHIPIQCHRCLTLGIHPISPDGKWPIKALDFVHGTIVDKKCQVILKPPSDTCPEYVILSLTVPGGENLMEVLLSMHYATYVINCEEFGQEDDEEIIEDKEIEAIFSNNQMYKSHAIESFKASKNEETDLINMMEPVEVSDNSSWYDMIEYSSNAPVSPVFLSELDKTPKSELRYKDLILPDSIVEFTVEVCGIRDFKSLTVHVTECDDLEVMAYIEEFYNLLDVIQNEAETLPIVTNPVKGHSCIGCYTEDSIWYRAVIREVLPHENLVKVHYVDYGNFEKIPIDRLREIKPDWTLTPVRAINVALHNIREGPHFDPVTCQSMLRDCLMTPPYTMTVESRFPSLQVELFSSEGELAYKHLIEAGLLTKDF